MVELGKSVYVPYGAYELKATYQRNMVFGMLTMVTFVTLAVTLPRVASLLIGTDTSTVIIEGSAPRDSILIDVNILPEPIVVPDHPVRPVAPSQNIVLTGNVVAIPESLATEEDDVRLPSQNELNILNGPGADAGASSGSGDLGAITDTGDAFPGPNVFVPVEKPPEMLDYRTPEYPRIARQLGQEGTVWVRVLVDTEGKVRNALVHVSSKIEALDTAALEAAFKNTFVPAIQNGRAVPCWVSYKVEFKIEN